MNKLFQALIIILLLVPYITIEAQKISLSEENKPDGYEKLLSRKKYRSSKGDFVSFYKVGNILYMEFPLKYIGRDILISTAITKTTHSEWMDVGNKIDNPLHGRFYQEDDILFLRQINSEIAYNKNDFQLSRAVEAAYMDKYINRFDIQAYNRDKSAVLIDVTDLFAGDVKELSPFPWHFNKVKMTFNKTLSHLVDFKSFDDNASVKTVLSYNYIPKQNDSDSREGICSAEVTRTILLLPEDIMKPRLGDSRLGFFYKKGKEIDYSETDQLNEFAYVEKWRLEPSDFDAWKHGKPVKPIKPIIIYVDNAFPDEWKPGIKRGIEAWNQAFEKIGLKEVMQAVDFPESDPDFDPDNLKYSCIRYVPTDRGSARAPSWVDPRSGEILNSSVMVWGNLSDILNIYRFIQTSHIDPRARAVKMPQDLMEESLSVLISHEIGHTLGLAHNMAGSAAYPVDSLRSGSFTKKYGLSASIMDYVNGNYVAQPEDTGVKLLPLNIGVYDELCIEYAYRPIPGNLSVKEEALAAEKWVDEKAGDPMYRYGVQQWTPVYDPSTLNNDLGNDPVKAGNYGIKNLRYILSNLNKWIPETNKTSHKYRIYNEIARQYASYIKNVAHNVGGIYLTRVKPGTPGNIFKAVDRTKQRESLLWVLDELKNSEWINERSVSSQFPLAIDKSVDIQFESINFLLQAADNVVLSVHISENPYPIKEYLDDLYQGVWGSTIHGEKLLRVDKIIQREFVNKLLDNMADEREKASKSRGYRDFFSAGCYHSFHDSESEEAFALIPGYGSQKKIDISRISEKNAYFRLYLSKVKTLIENKIKDVDIEDQAHYYAILGALNDIETVKQ